MGQRDGFMSASLRHHTGLLVPVEHMLPRPLPSCRHGGSPNAARRCGQSRTDLWSSASTPAPRARRGGGVKGDGALRTQRWQCQSRGWCQRDMAWQTIDRRHHAAHRPQRALRGLTLMPQPNTPIFVPSPSTPPHLCCHRILLHQGLLGEVDLQRIVGGERHGEAAGKERGHGVAVVVEEELR